MDDMLPRLRTAGLVLLLFLALAPEAGAWTWPSSGVVLRPFSLGNDPYLGGQHRGIDVGGAEGEPVLAPRAGTVAFAHSMPTSGLTVTIRTDDGYSITLVHLGSVAVKRTAAVREGDPVGTLGTSGEAEWAVPYVHLGVRLASDPNGYVDPERLLPPRPAPTAASPQPPAPPPAADPAPVAAPAPQAPEKRKPPSPAPAAPREAPAPVEPEPATSETEPAARETAPSVPADASAAPARPAV